MKLRTQKRMLAAVFISPAFVIYSMFVVLPYAKAFRTSLYRWSGLSDSMRFIGLANFKELLFEDSYFWISFGHTFRLLLVVGLIIPAVALFFAVLLTKGMFGTKFYRAVYFFPRLVSMVAIGILWSFIYNPIFGLLNGLLGLVGLDRLQHAWLGEPDTALWAIMAALAWIWIGYFVLIFNAGILNIPRTFYEAAIVDGAGEWKQFWRITVPLLWETLRTAIVFVIIRILSTFDLVKVMTGGGPNRNTEVIGTYFYEVAFQNSRFGYASAMAVLLFALIFGLSWLSMRLMRRDTIEY